MADSDGEYVDNVSSDGYEDHHVEPERGEDRQSHAAGRVHGSGGGHHRAGGGGGSGGGGGRGSSSGGGGRRRNGRREGQAASWETVKRSWDTVGEAEDGQVLGIEFLEAAKKRRRVLRDDTTPLQRGIIRHMVLVLDMSFAMASRDYLPSCHRVALSCAADFVRAFFEQNPIAQLAILAMRDGVALRISDMGGNPAEHLEHLHEWDAVEPQGHASLQNALEMCRGALFHTPSHGTREVLIIFGSLLSSDPGDIHDTIASLMVDRIRVSIVGLAAQVAICSEICSRTNDGGGGGGVSGKDASLDADADADVSRRRTADDSTYVVALHDVHFRELVLAATTPPATRAPPPGSSSAAGGDGASQASLLMMGFPSRTITDADVAGGGGLSVCACHNRPMREGYACTRCATKVCRLPAECPACGLTLILSTHLARSYHHLFPLRNWVEVSWTAAAAAVAQHGSGALGCHACLVPFPEIPPPAKIRDLQNAAAEIAAAAAGAIAATAATSGGGGGGRNRAAAASSSAASSAAAAAAAAAAAKELKGVSESGRYACPVCGHHFCIDCDVFTHEVIHNCPGCQSDTRPPQPVPATAAPPLPQQQPAKQQQPQTAPKVKKVMFVKNKSSGNNKTAANGASEGASHIGEEMVIDE